MKGCFNLFLFLLLFSSKTLISNALAADETSSETESASFLSKYWWAILLAIIVLIIVILVSVGFYFFLLNKDSKKRNQPRVQKAPAMPSTAKKPAAVEVVDEMQNSKEPSSKNISKDEVSSQAADPPAPQEKKYLRGNPPLKLFRPLEGSELERAKRPPPKNLVKQEPPTKTQNSPMVKPSPEAPKTSEVAAPKILLGELGLIASPVVSLFNNCMDEKELDVYEKMKKDYPMLVKTVYECEVKLFLLPVSRMLKRLNRFANHAKEALENFNVKFDRSQKIIQMTDVARLLLSQPKTPAYVVYFAFGAEHHRYLKDDIKAMTHFSVPLLMVVALQPRFSDATRCQALAWLRRELPRIRATIIEESRSKLSYPINLIERIYKKDPAIFNDLSAIRSDSYVQRQPKDEKKSARSSISKTSAYDSTGGDKTISKKTSRSSISKASAYSSAGGDKTISKKTTRSEISKASAYSSAGGDKTISKKTTRSAK